MANTTSTPSNVTTSYQWHQKLTFSVSEAVVATGLGRTTLYSLMKTGRLKYTRVVGRRLIDGRSLRALVLSEVAE